MIKEIIQRWKDRKIPKIYLASNDNRIALVREKDLKEALAVYSKKFGGLPKKNLLVFVPNTMIFSDTPSYILKEWITGTLRDLAELRPKCKLIHCGGFLVPFSTEIWPIEEQKKVFNPINLKKAHELLFSKKITTSNK